MTKSSSEFLQGLIGAIIADCIVKVPRLRKEFERDLSRLHSAYEDRGLSFFTIDLPDAGKHFDRCLSDGSLTPFQMPHMRPFKKGTVIPRLFRGLLSEVFTDSGALRDNPDALFIELLRELYYFLKKLNMECEDGRLYREVSAFFEIEQGVRAPTLDWDGDVLNIERLNDLHFYDHRCIDVLPLFDNDQLDLSRVQEATSISDGFATTFHSVCDIVSATLGGIKPIEWKSKHGPGAVSDLKGGDSKYDFPNWPDKLDNQFPMSDFAFANHNIWADYINDGESWGFSPHEPPAKLIAVPKTQKGPRLIASEPTAHQWIQQLVRRFIIDTLHRTPIYDSVHFSDQSYNQERARLASLGSGHATVDLSSASDRLTCWTVERVFRSNPSLLSAMHSCRTRWMKNTIDKKSPEYIKLRKFACQGSALTFSVQTIIYACAAIASVLYENRTVATIHSIRRASKEVQVYGDDTVIPIYALDSYQGLLEYLDFKVNHTKTYGTGKFRESCGTEWYDGDEVTPVYFRSIPEKARPESLISAIEVSNNFYSRGYYQTADLIKSTVQRLVPKNSVPFVQKDSGALGWKRHFPDLDWRPRTRYLKDLQRMAIQVLTLSSVSLVKPIQGGSSLLQYFTEEPDPTVMWESGVRTRPKLNLKLRWERSELFLSPLS
jgi:hypothetical protein